MDYVVYDLEIEKAIPDKKEEPEAGIAYCKGWGDHAGMGVSVLCAYDSADDRCRVFDEHNKDEWDEVVCRDRSAVFVGFNSLRFDNKVLAACGWSVPIEGRCYDILREMWIADDLNPDSFSRDHGGYGLDATCAAQGWTGKTGYGGHAPAWWQRGEHARVIDYCLEDVRLTRNLFRRILAGESLGHPKPAVRATTLLRHPDSKVAAPV